MVSSASFTVTAAVTGPTITVQPTSQTVSAPAAASFSITATTSSGTISHQLQHQPSGGGGYSNVGSPSVVASGVGASVSTGATAISGGSNNNGDTYRFASTDGTGTNYSSVVTLTVTAPAATFTSEVLTRNNGSVAVSSALTWVRWYNPATGELVLSKGGISTNASGVFSTADTALSTGTTYALDWLEATGQRRMPTKAAT